MKGRPSAGFSWLCVNEDVDQPAASSSSFLYTQQHKDRVMELVSWSKEQKWIETGSATTCLCHLVAGQFCDLVCQVVGTVVEEDGVCFVARVWDGSRCQHPVVCTERELDKVDYRLEDTAADLAVDIWIYDNHFHHYQSTQPGQFIKLCNLHAAVHKGEQSKTSSSAALPTLELTLHRGTSYGRGLVLLNTQSPHIKDVKRKMDSCISSGSKTQGRPAERQSESSQASSVGGAGVDDGQRALTPVLAAGCSVNTGEAGCSHWDCGKPVHRSRERERTAVVVSSSSQDTAVLEHVNVEREEELGEGEGFNSGNPASEHGHAPVGGVRTAGKDQPSPHSSAETCMLQTASIISGHQHISHSSLSDVLTSKVPSKFRVLAHLVEFYPDTVDPSHFLRQLCPACFLLKSVSLGLTCDGEMESDIPSLKQTDLSLPYTSTRKLAGLCGGKFADWDADTENTTLCPRCLKDGKCVSLEVIYMLRLVLRDSSGRHMAANVWRDQAVQGLSSTSDIGHTRIFCPNVLYIFHVTFFRGVEPEAVLKDKGVLQELVSTLRSLRVPQDPQKPFPPRLDCCLFSYSATGEPAFHMFDTILV
ncbi:protection of telomeres protein 1-like [Littorina saxatilis]|uniref:protection of telomeres protein 1-like n=1 Tax=Littorina saxatilis TaxID=31220 RepID=UPI0038B619EA